MAILRSEESGQGDIEWISMSTLQSMQSSNNVEICGQWGVEDIWIVLWWKAWGRFTYYVRRKISRSISEGFRRGGRAERHCMGFAKVSGCFRIWPKVRRRDRRDPARVSQSSGELPRASCMRYQKRIQTQFSTSKTQFSFFWNRGRFFKIKLFQI